MRKYSTVRARAKLLGGMITKSSTRRSTKLLSEKALGSTTAESTLVNTLNSSDTRAS
jgi:hypothetical protein